MARYSNLRYGRECRGKTIRPFHFIPSSNLNEWKVALLVRVDWENVLIRLMRDTGQMPPTHTHALLYINSNAGEGEYSKYIHGMFRAISARDHTILPPRGDKIRYFSYFHVFSFIFSFWGRRRRKSLASGKINKHLKRFHC